MSCDSISIPNGGETILLQSECSYSGLEMRMVQKHVNEKSEGQSYTRSDSRIHSIISANEGNTVSSTHKDATVSGCYITLSSL